MPDLSPASELGREHDLVTTAAQRAPEVRLALTVAVALGGVEERHARLERGIDDGARPVLVDPPAEVVAPEADDRDLERAERPRLHRTEPTARRLLTHIP